MNKIRPTRIRLEACSLCQMGCPLCPVHSGVERPAVGLGFLKPDDFQTLLERNPRLRRVELSNFGEIFLNPHLLDIMRCAHERRVMLTASDGVNFNRVSEEVLEGLVKYRFEYLSCAIDGATDETYRLYRTNGSLPVVLANIRRLNELKRLHGSTRPRLQWQFIVFGHNEHEIEKARAMAAELGMEFALKFNWDTRFSPVRDVEVVRREMGAASEAEYRQVFGRHVSDADCRRLWLEPQINWDGRVLGCSRNFWQAYEANAFSDGLVAAVNSPGVRYARQMLLGKKPPRADIPCSTCDVYQDRGESGRWVDKNVVAPSPGYRAVAAVRHRARTLMPLITAPRRGPTRRLAPNVHPLPAPSALEPGRGFENVGVFRGHTTGLYTWSCHLTTQAPGTRPHAAHSHKEEEVLLLLDGELDVILPQPSAPGGERRMRVRAGQVVYYPAFHVHTVETTSAEPSFYLALSWFNRRNTNARKIAEFSIQGLRFGEAVAEGATYQAVFWGPTRYLNKIQCHTAVIAPGQGQEVHKDDYDVVLVILDGVVQTLGAEAPARSLVLYPQGEPHGMLNTGRDHAKLVAFELHGLTLGPGSSFLVWGWSLFRRAWRKAGRGARRLRARLKAYE
jgi:mannose-6-phosphate isomerase-like protein (cupin superfamily)